MEHYEIGNGKTNTEILRVGQNNASCHSGVAALLGAFYNKLTTFMKKS